MSDTSREPIPREHMRALLVSAGSGFQEWRSVNSGDAPDDDDPLYVWLGTFARFVVELVRRSDLAQLRAIADTIELLHVHGDAFVREAATAGLLESVQNQAGWEQVSTDPLTSLYGPETMRWWDSLETFWKGQIPYLGADIATSRKPI